jgi:hypothetical protein
VQVAGSRNISGRPQYASVNPSTHSRN